jgi:hypothetical protein
MSFNTSTLGTIGLNTGFDPSYYSVIVQRLLGSVAPKGIPNILYRRQDNDDEFADYIEKVIDRYITFNIVFDKNEYRFDGLIPGYEQNIDFKIKDINTEIEPNFTISNISIERK